MPRKRTEHVSLLEHASERMLHLSHSTEFIHWSMKTLFKHMHPSHVAVALYNRERKIYSIEFSYGTHRIPPGLIAFDMNSPFGETDALHGIPAQSVYHFNKPMTLHKFIKRTDSQSGLIVNEMKRHHLEVVARIDLHDHVAGYLLIGPKADGKPYKLPDIAYFQVIANDIAIEMEKEEYFRESHLDPLTQTLNRQSLSIRFKQLQEKYALTGKEGALAMMDLDDFKHINDHHGHLAGDQVLRITAGLIQGNIRKCDLVFRYGGEEFLLLIEKNTRDPSATLSTRDFHKATFKMLERVRLKICERPIDYLSQSIPIHVSVGVAFFTGAPEQTLDGIIAQADQALYRSKKNGKNRVTLFEELPHKK